MKHVNYSAPLPMLAYPYDERHIIYPCLVQRKFNGVRAMIAPDGRIWSRHGREFRHLANQFGAYDIWIDGELYFPNRRLQDVVGNTNLHFGNDESKTLHYVAFDLIEDNLGQISRIEKLVKALINPLNPRLTIASSVFADSLGHAVEHFGQKKYLHFDGLIFRNPAANYGHGRSRALHKRKDEFDEEFLCVGAIEGEKRLTGTLGALTLRTQDGVTFNCGGGFTMEDRIKFWADKPIGEMISVSFPYKSSRGIPQCPQFLAVRSKDI